MQFTITLTDKEVSALKESMGIDNPETYYGEIIKNNANDAINNINQKVLASVPIEEAVVLIEGYKNLTVEDKAAVDQIISKPVKIDPIGIDPKPVDLKPVEAVITS